MILSLHLNALLLGTALLLGCAHPAPNRICLLTGTRSTLGWGIARDVTGVGGKVIHAEDATPFAQVTVDLSPGNFKTSSDTNGAFALGLVPSGRYQIRVRRIGYGTLSDSISVGDEPLMIVAVLAGPPADLRGCAVPGRSRAP